MAARGSTRYKKVAYNIIWILEIIQYAPCVLPVLYVCLPLNISAALGLHSPFFYVRVHPGGFACACMHTCLCVHLTHCGMFPGDKTAVPGPLQPSPKGTQWLEESLTLCRAPLCSHGTQHDTLHVHTEVQKTCGCWFCLDFTEDFAQLLSC